MESPMQGTRPYTEAQWQAIKTLGETVEADLQRLNVQLMMGGEPTFVAIDDFESPEWRTEALGTEKRQRAAALRDRLAAQFASPGCLLYDGVGKLYPGEVTPRWALACYWRSDGIPLWPAPLPTQPIKPHSPHSAHTLITHLAQHLHLPTDLIQSAYEVEAEEPAGYVLPLLPIPEPAHPTGLHWSSCRWAWDVPDWRLYPGEGPIGLRLPLGNLVPPETLLSEATLPLQPGLPTAQHPVHLAPDNTIQVALSVEVREDRIQVFLPPWGSAQGFVDLVAAIAQVATLLKFPVRLGGYLPAASQGLVGFQITPDPGVIEVNIHPVASWQALVTQTLTLYDTAAQCQLGTEKYDWNGQRLSTGGGAHITLGGTTLAASPLLRRPDLLRSLITYWQHHPSLSYLFAGLFVGPTSQSPRVDEGRHESLYELEVAFQTLSTTADVPPAVVDRLLRNLLIDVTGNTHRAEFCIDKLYPVENPRNQLGILEFRAVAMPPSAPMRLLQLLLIRACVARFWQQPYARPLIRWGTTLHDRFLLPHYLEQDLRQVLMECQEAGYDFDLAWFQPFFAFRFPVYGTTTFDTGHGSLQLELRHAIEPWHVLGEEMHNGRTARYVDASLERLQVKLQGLAMHSPNADGLSDRYQVLCNGQRVPLRSTGRVGEYVGGVRFRARQTLQMLHPVIAPHAPLHFTVVDTWHGPQSLGGCVYHVQAPDGQGYATLPETPEVAAHRCAERFIPQPPQPGVVTIPPLRLNPEYPLTLDLRWEIG
ncbi:transglutaminase family protein [Trichothermofontia sp.]